MRCPSMFQSRVEVGMNDNWRTSPEDCLTDSYGTSALYPSLSASFLTMHLLVPYHPSDSIHTHALVYDDASGTVYDGKRLMSCIVVQEKGEGQCSIAGTNIRLTNSC